MAAMVEFLERIYTEDIRDQIPRTCLLGAEFCYQLIIVWRQFG